MLNTSEKKSKILIIFEIRFGPPDDVSSDNNRPCHPRVQRTIVSRNPIQFSFRRTFIATQPQ